MSAWGSGGSARSCDALLARVESNDPTLTELVILPMKSFGVAEMERISTALATGANTHLKSLSASGHSLPPACLARFGAALAQDKSSLVRLAFGDRNMGDSGIMAFCKELERVDGGKIESLDLAWKDISTTGFVAVGRALGASKHLKEIDLSRNAKLVDDIDFMRSNWPQRGDGSAFLALEELNFSECNLDPDRLKVLRECLFPEDSSGRSVQKLRLVLDNNPIQTEACVLVSVAMKSKIPFLYSLSLSGCGIDDDGFASICEAAVSTPHQILQTLNLSNNRLTESGAQSLSRSLFDGSVSHWTHLEELSLAGNALTEEGVKSIAQSLSHKSDNGERVDQNRVLKSLDLTNTECGVDGAVAMLRCTSLATLRLFNNKLRSEGFEAIADVLRGGHPSLVNLDLGGNDASVASVVLLMNSLAAISHEGFTSKLRVLEIGGNGSGPEVEEAIKSLQIVHPELDVARDRPKKK